MMEALKKLVGLDKKSVEARKKAAEEERREREQRVAKEHEALAQVADSQKEER